MQELRDIKGIVEVSDDSLLYFGITIGVAILIILLVVYILFFRHKRIRNRFIRSAEEIAKEKIESMNYQDPKNVAYTFGEDVRMFVQPDQQAQYNALLEALEVYKYKKDIPSLDPDLQNKIQDFIKGITWNI